MTPIVSRRGKPLRNKQVRSRALAVSGQLCTRDVPIGPGWSKSKMMPAPNRPVTPITDAAERQDEIAISPAVIAGSAIFPRSPAKL